MRLPDESVDINLGAGRATMRFSDQHVRDFGNILNSLGNGVSTPAIVSYDLEWSGVTQRAQVQNDKQGYAGLFLNTSATINWSGSSDSGSFTTVAAGQTTVFAQIGHEHNGVFFP